MKFQVSTTLVLVALLGTAVPAGAQTSDSRSFPAVFGAVGQSDTTSQTLQTTISFAEAYDDNALESGNGGPFALASPLQTSGFYTGANASLSYERRFRRASFVLNGGADARYYRPASTVFFLNRYVGAGLSAQLNQRTELSLNQSVSFAPSQLYSLLPELGDDELGQVTASGSDYSLRAQDSFVSDSSLQLRYRFTRHTSFVTLGNYRASSYPDQRLPRRLRSYGVGGRFEHTMSRWATLHLGYVYRSGEFEGAGRPGPNVIHDLDVGIDYNRPLSFSRHSRIEFGVGSAIINSPVSAGDEEQLQYRVIGHATFTHEFGRSWVAALNYNRGAGFVEAANQTAFSDAAYATLNGAFTRRLDLYVSAGVSAGDVNALNTLQPKYRTYVGTTRLRWALNRNWATYGEYVLYYYDLGEALPLNNLPSTLRRNSVRIGLTMWFPLLGR